MVDSVIEFIKNNPSKILRWTVSIHDFVSCLYTTIIAIMVVHGVSQESVVRYNGNVVVTSQTLKYYAVMWMIGELFLIVNICFQRYFTVNVNASKELKQRLSLTYLLNYIMNGVIFCNQMGFLGEWEKAVRPEIRGATTALTTVQIFIWFTAFSCVVAYFDIYYRESFYGCCNNLLWIISLPVLLCIHFIGWCLIFGPVFPVLILSCYYPDTFNYIIAMRSFIWNGAPIFQYLPPLIVAVIYMIFVTIAAAIACAVSNSDKKRSDENGVVTELTNPLVGTGIMVLGMMFGVSYINEAHLGLSVEVFAFGVILNVLFGAMSIIIATVLLFIAAPDTIADVSAALYDTKVILGFYIAFKCTQALSVLVFPLCRIIQKWNEADLRQVLDKVLVTFDDLCKIRKLRLQIENQRTDQPSENRATGVVTGEAVSNEPRAVIYGFQAFESVNPAIANQFEFGIAENTALLTHNQAVELLEKQEKLMKQHILDLLDEAYRIYTILDDFESAVFDVRGRPWKAQDIE